MLEILFGLILLIFVGYILKIAFLAVVISGSGLEVVSSIVGFCVLAILLAFVAYTVKFAGDEMWKLFDKRKQRKEEAAEEKVRLDEYNRKEEKRKRIMMASFLDDPDFHTPNYNKRPIPLSSSVPDRN